MSFIASESVKPPIDILLIEDNAGDVFVIEQAMRECGVSCDVYLAADGETAMKFLRQTGEYVASPRPQLIFLDLNLPGKDGREVLAEIKADPNFSTIPVIVITECSSDKDILKSYQCYANSYVLKSFHFDQYNRTIQVLTNFWLKFVQLPGRASTVGAVAASSQLLKRIRPAPLST